MINRQMYELGSHRSTIREIFEYGNQRAAIVGRENVLDFSLGNPNVPAPDEVRQAILAEAAGDPVAIHGYTSAPGAPDVRRTLADSLNRRFGTDYTGDSLYLTAGAAAALMCAFRALACEGDEFVVFAPFFPEYKMFIESGAGAKCVLVPPSIEDFQIDFDAFEKVDMTVCKVKSCENVKKSKKLLKFTLDDGERKDRVILSGIHEYYEPEELVGKTCVAITNLPPRKMMGIDSEGMLISAVYEYDGREGLNLLMLDDSIPAGAKLY